MTETHERKGIALLLLCLVQFMVVLDIAIVNVALPTIKTRSTSTRPTCPG